MIILIHSTVMVVTLTEEAFYQLNTPTVVQFMSNWCSQCNKFKQQYEQLSQQVKSIQFAYVDCINNTKICSSMGIISYPTIKYLNQNETNDYEGNLQFDDLKTWSELQLKPFLEYTTVQELQDLAKQQNQNTYFYFATNNIEQYNQIHSKLKGTCVVGSIYTDGAQDQLVAIRESKKIYFKQNLSDMTQVQYFINNNKQKLLTFINLQNFDQLLKTAPLIILFGDANILASQISEMKTFALQTDIDSNFCFLQNDNNAKLFVQTFNVNPEYSQLLFIDYKKSDFHKSSYVQFDVNKSIGEQIKEFNNFLSQGQNEQQVIQKDEL